MGARHTVKPRAKSKVDLLIDGDVWAVAIVDEPLASQFLCHVKGQPNRQRFYFYADMGLTWRPHQ